MEEPDVLVYAQKAIVLAKFPRLYHKLAHRFGYIQHQCGSYYEGSWSRGYDVALTWQRSPVQFWPSPPPFQHLDIH